MAGLWKHDRQWLEEHAVEVVSGTPAALKTYLRSRLWSDDLDPRPLLLSLRGKLPSATVHAAIRAVYPEGVERLMYLFESAPATLEERDGQPPAPQTSSGAPLWAANDSGNPDLIRTHIALARQLPTQDEQAARLYFLGNALAELSGGHVEEGLTVLREAAQLGSHHAAYDAALILFHGEDVEKDLVAARVLLEQAAESGAPWAGYELSIWLRQGIGGEVETERADNLEELAAKTGHPQACMNRGARIASGELGEIEMDQVVALYARAAEGGSANAAARLFLMYLNGDGIDADEQQAKTWFARAEQLGFDWDTLPPS
jgi:hypothetical protein